MSEISLFELIAVCIAGFAVIQWLVTNKFPFVPLAILFILMFAQSLFLVAVNYIRFGVNQAMSLVVSTTAVSAPNTMVNVVPTAIPGPQQAPVVSTTVNAAAAANSAAAANANAVVVVPRPSPNADEQAPQRFQAVCVLKSGKKIKVRLYDGKMRDWLDDETHLLIAEPSVGTVIQVGEIRARYVGEKPL